MDGESADHSPQVRYFEVDECCFQGSTCYVHHMRALDKHNYPYSPIQASCQYLAKPILEHPSEGKHHRYLFQSSVAPKVGVGQSWEYEMRLVASAEARS